MRTMELLAPAGGREQLEYAVHFGADAVYLATERYGMRRRAENFSEADLPAAVAYAHERGVRVHVAVNTAMGDADTDDLPRYFRLLERVGVDAVIVGDMGAIAIARDAAPGLEMHLSTQASCMNAASAKAYQGLGIRRIVVAREMSLEAIAEMRRRMPADMQIEAFAHGAMCMAYSGRCLISDYLTGRGANVGHCTQPCRWKYALVEETRPGEYFPVGEDERGSFILSSHDMNMLAHLDALAAAGVDSIKIEGRAKGAYYVASVVNAYRHVLDGQSAADWEGELETTSHRPWCTGFYFGYPGQNQGSVEYARAYQMVACVEEGEASDAPNASAASDMGRKPFVGADAKGDATDAPHAPAASSEADVRDDGASDASECREAQGETAHPAVVLCRNRFRTGDTVEVLSPGKPVHTFTLGDIVWHAGPDADVAEVQRKGAGEVMGHDPGNPGGMLVRVPVANRTMERYTIFAPFALRPRDILRAYRPEQDLGRAL